MIDVEGIEQTIMKLALRNEEIHKKFKMIINRSALNIERDAKKRVSVGPTGNLRDSIKAKVVPGSEQLSRTVFPRTKSPYRGYHRHLIEYGTKYRINTGKKTGKYAGRKIGRIQAKPFMRPAHEAEEPNYINEIKKVVDEHELI